MGWNYRIGTKIFSYKEEFKECNPELAAHDDIRMFSIIEVYYDENGTPNGYAEVSALQNWETIKDLRGTHKLIGKAFKNSVLDLDNWPKEWKE
ncbi:MAG: hypothetical protein NC238_01220 [Dehalobacter sp.]|nr:hypothetical protein [Dehalobacter sp.]